MVNQKVAVSGSHGFIGKNLVNHLVNTGNTVFTIPRDMLFSDPDFIRKIFEKDPVDYIFHLGAYGNHSFQDSPPQTILTNYVGTFNLLWGTKDIPYKKFINFSTSSIQLPTKTFYSVTKAGTEDLGAVFAEDYKKNILSVRPASIFGEFENLGRFIPQMIVGLVNGSQAKLDPTPTHSWLYIKDFIDGLLYAVEGSRVEPVINISYNEMWTNLEIVKKLEKISKKSLDFEEVPNMRVYDAENWLVKSPLQYLGWKPPFGIDKGLEQTYKWYKKGLEENRKI